MIRLYDTNKGVIATDELNNSLRKPDHRLVFYDIRYKVARACYTKEPFTPDNLVEEIQNGMKTNFNMQRIMDECSLIKRMTTITEETYNKTIINYEHPGCIGMITRALRIRKTFDDMLREKFPETKS